MLAQELVPNIDVNRHVVSKPEIPRFHLRFHNFLHFTDFADAPSVPQANDAVHGQLPAKNISLRVFWTNCDPGVIQVFSFVPSSHLARQFHDNNSYDTNGDVSVLRRIFPNLRLPFISASGAVVSLHQ